MFLSPVSSFLCVRLTVVNVTFHSGVSNRSQLHDRSVIMCKQAIHYLTRIPAAGGAWWQTEHRVLVDDFEEAVGGRVVRRTYVRVYLRHACAHKYATISLATSVVIVYTLPQPFSFYAPAHRAESLSDDTRLTSVCLTSVCLSRTSGLSREQRVLGGLKLA